MLPALDELLKFRVILARCKIQSSLPPCGVVIEFALDRCNRLEGVAKRDGSPHGREMLWRVLVCEPLPARVLSLGQETSPGCGEEPATSFEACSRALFLSYLREVGVDEQVQWFQQSPLGTLQEIDMY